MRDITEFHKGAMECAELAQAARLRGQHDEFLALTSKALEMEKTAALALQHEVSLEPTRSVLFRSAASLALECGKIRDAEQLIAMALAGNPPAAIANELRDLIEDVYFQRHLELRGVTLKPGEGQMSLEGAGIGFGITKSELFVQRIRDLETLLYRTAERKLGRPFREAGRKVKRLAEGLELYMSAPRAASFAVTLKLGQTTQTDLFDAVFSDETMSSVLFGLRAVNAGELESLEKEIPDEAYRINFINLAGRLAPDGDEVRSVGFTSVLDGVQRATALKTPQRVIRQTLTPRAVKEPSAAGNQPLEITGVLLEANAKDRDNGSVEIVDDNGKSVRLEVPRGMMSDIVKPMFEERVSATGTPIANGRIRLQSIALAEA